MIMKDLRLINDMITHPFFICHKWITEIYVNEKARRLFLSKHKIVLYFQYLKFYPMNNDLSLRQFHGLGA